MHSILFPDPPDVFVIDYNNGTLFCNATGNPGIHKYSQWEHRSSNNKHIRYLDGRQNGYLLIPNLNGLPWFCKSGTYICSAENGITNNHRLYSTGSIHVEFEGINRYAVEFKLNNGVCQLSFLIISLCRIVEITT